MVAGNATLWKPSPSTPLCSIAVTKIVSRVLEKNGLPGAIAGVFIGGKDAGKAVVESDEVDLGKLLSWYALGGFNIQRQLSVIHWVGGSRPTSR